MTFIEKNPDTNNKSSLFQILDAKTSFWLGFGAAILSIGTIGFIILGSCVLKGSCSIGSFSNKTDSNTVSDTINTNSDTTPSENVPVVTKDDHIRGNVNAKITLVEYSDFQCPYCGSFHPTMNKVIEEYKDKVRWVYRHFPLSFHPNAQPAALAAECASEQGKFWEFADSMFANQDSLGDEYYKKLATDNKLNIKKFNDCYSSKKYLNKIQSQAQTGGAAGVDGTPGTFVVDQNGNATPLKGAVQYETIKAEIDKLLK